MNDPENITYTFVKDLRPATRQDFVSGKDVKHGTAYYLKSVHTQQFEGPYILWPDSDLQQFATYLKAEMVYVEQEVQP